MAKKSCSFGYAIHTLLVFGLVAVCLVLPRQVSCNLPALCDIAPPSLLCSSRQCDCHAVHLAVSFSQSCCTVAVAVAATGRASGVGRRARYVLAAKLAAITCNIGYTYLHIDAIPSRSHTRLSVSLPV